MRIAWTEVPWRGRSALAGQTDDVDLLIGTNGPEHVLWQQALAGLAREHSLVVVAGGPPSGGVFVLAAMGADVIAARTIALATPAGQRRRGACLVEVAPHGRSDAARWCVVATDLSADELEHHRAELAARIPALGLRADRVLVACVERRLLDGLAADSGPEPTVGPAALRFAV